MVWRYTGRRTLPPSIATGNTTIRSKKANCFGRCAAGCFYKCWHFGGRLSKEYHTIDLITDILGGGESSRLHQKMVKELQMFVAIQCYHLGSIDPGIVCIEGKLSKGVKWKTQKERLKKYSLS